MLHQAAFIVALINNPAFFGVVAEEDGRIVGSNFLDERCAVRGVGPITIDPDAQSRGVGRKLMQAVIERGRSQQAPSIRLVQDAFNTVWEQGLTFEQAYEELVVRRRRTA